MLISISLPLDAMQRLIALPHLFNTRGTCLPTFSQGLHELPITVLYSQLPQPYFYGASSNSSEWPKTVWQAASLCKSRSFASIILLITLLRY